MLSSTLLVSLAAAVVALPEVTPTHPSLLFASMPKKGPKKNLDKFSGVQLPQQNICTNACTDYVNDGDCDDGGDGSEYNFCDAGTDCNDCQRIEGAQPMIDDDGYIVNVNCDCFYSSDNDCDDGGVDSEYDVCALASDCNDCAPRKAGDITSQDEREAAKERYRKSMEQMAKNKAANEKAAAEHEGDGSDYYYYYGHLKNP